MLGLLVLLLAFAASAKESEAAHARHWRNYLNSLLVQLAQEPPQPDLRHELWKDMFSHRVRSFLVGDQYESQGGLAARTGPDYSYGDDENPGGEGVVDFAGRGMPNDDRLNEAWRQHVGDVLLARPALVQRHWHSTRTSPSTSAVEVFSPYNRRTTKRTTTKLLNSNSSYSPHMHRFLDVINAHGAARHLREPAPQTPQFCRCSARENETGNGSSLHDQAMTSITTRQPPLLLVVPGLMVAPRGGPFAIVREIEATNISDVQQPPNVAHGAASPSPPWPEMPKGKLHRRRLRFVLLLVTLLFVLSSLVAYYVRSFLARYRREYEIIRNAQFL